MKKIIQLFLMCLSIFILPCANAAMSPVGYWKTLDDVTGKATSILHIYQSGKTLYGKVVKILPGNDQYEVCAACKGPRHNQRILGMVVMEGLTQNPDNPAQWHGGEVLDPRSGKIYRCTITVINNGQSLNARGYIGFALFGRSQTWERVASLNN